MSQVNRTAAGQEAQALPSASVPRVSIGELSLSFAGVAPAAAQRIAERAMQLASERLPPGVGGEFAELALTVRPRRFNETEWSEAIAEALVDAVRTRSVKRA